MKSSPWAAWLVVLLIAGLGVMGCGEADVPFSPEGSTTDPNNRAILTHVTSAVGGFAERDVAGVSIHGNYAYVGGMSFGRSVLTNIGVRIVDVSDPTNPELVGRIPLRQPGGQPTTFGVGSGPRTHGDAVATSLATAAFEGDVAIVLFGVPDEETILYEFTVDDPTTYGGPWGGEIPFRPLNDRVYEYACHEGNYALSNILSGERYQERLEAQEKSDSR